MRILESESQRNLIDNLRAHGLDKLIDLPQIAVVGDTSSGKSSLLSAVSGIEFPSSHELTTRCPTQLILSHAKQFSGTVRLQRYVATNDLSEIKTLSSMKDIPQFISYFTKKLVDEGQSISDDSIIVEVFGPNFFDLTLIDLPGIVRTVGDGEDPLIIPKVKELVARHMKQKHTIILAVLPANVDIHNSEVLQNASEVDPKGERTLGIITKSDLIDQGAESSVIDILNNTKKYLHHGYHAVICRGQTDLNKGATIECGLNKEMLYFQNQVAWQKVAKSNLGIQTLGKKLVNLLDEQIEAALPSVLKEVDMKLGECRSRLDVLGYALDTPSARHSSYINIMHQYDAFIRQANLGDYSHEFFLEEGIDNKLRARIIKEELKFQKILQNIRFDSKMYIKIAIGDYVDVNFKDDWIDACVVSLPQTNGSIQITLDSSVDPKKIVQRLSAPKWRIKDKIAVDGLKELIQDRRGDQLPIFPSHAIFSNLVGEHINKWIHPSISLLEEDTNTSTSKIIDEMKCKCEQALKDALRQEIRPNTRNKDLTDILANLREIPLLESIGKLNVLKDGKISYDAVVATLKQHGQGNSSNEEHEAKEMEIYVSAYLKVSMKRVTDNVPMLIEQFFTAPSILEIQKKSCFGESELEEAFSEPQRVIEERIILKEREDALMKSKKEIQAIRL